MLKISTDHGTIRIIRYSNGSEENCYVSVKKGGTLYFANYQRTILGT